MVEIEVVRVEKPPEVNVIIGQCHFIKSIEDIYEAIVGSVPNIKFGLAFCEASQERLVRIDGTDEEMIDLAAKNAMKIGCGHTFVVMLKNAYPINVLNAIKNVQEVVSLYCATANDVSVIVAKEGEGRGILGVIDGLSPVGIEKEENIRVRKEFLRKIGYKR